jgi:hypothetical protein
MPRPSCPSRAEHPPPPIFPNGDRQGIRIAARLGQQDYHAVLHIHQQPVTAKEREPFVRPLRHPNLETLTDFDRSGYAFSLVLQCKTIVSYSPYSIIFESVPSIWNPSDIQILKEHEGSWRIQTHWHHRCIPLDDKFNQAVSIKFSINGIH